MSRGSGNGNWRISTGLAFWGSTVQAVFNFIAIITLMYLAYNFTDIIMRGARPSLSSMSLDYYEDAFAGFFGSAAICFIIAFFGYLLYLIGICLFKSPQDSPNSAKRVNYIILAELIMPCLLVLFIIFYWTYPKALNLLFEDLSTTVITLIGIWVLSVVAVAISITQFKALTKEETWSEKARKGADDLKFSYSCILWMEAAVIICVGMMALIAYSSYTSIQSTSVHSYDMSGAMYGISSVSNQLQTLMSLGKAMMMICFIIVFVFFLLHTIYRILGWNKIQHGGNEEVYVFTRKATPESGSTSHEENAVSSGDPQQSLKHFSGITIVYEDEKADERKKWMLWGGIAAGVIVLAVAIWAIWGRSDKFEPNSKIYADRSVVFKTIEDGVGIEAMDELIYGTPIENFGAGKDVAGKWIEVAYESNRKILKGFMAKEDLLDSEDFEALYKAGLSDGQARFHLPGKGQRLAVLDAVKGNGAEWHLEGIKLYGAAQPNAKRLYVRGADPSEVCLGFVMRNSSTGGRKFFLYSTPDPYSTDITNDPVFLYSETPGKGEDIVYDASYRKKGNKYEVIYQTNSDSDGSEDFLYDGSAIDEAEVLETETVLEGQAEMTGYVDGKYPVKIEVTLHEDGTVSGTVTYLKYNVPMKLIGTYTIGDGYCDLSLDELSEGKVSGNFIGKYYGNSFSGSWVSADGEKEMPFRVER